MAGISSGWNVTIGNDDVAAKTFYGFRRDPATGRLYNDINDGVDGTAISMPDEVYPDAAGYSIYYWTTTKHIFSINANGHLVMEIR